MRVLQPLIGQRIADSLKFELFLWLLFWLPYVVPETWNPFVWPWVGFTWLAFWLMSPILSLLGFMFLPRDMKLRGGLPQIVLAAALAGSIWWKFSSVELF